MKFIKWIVNATKQTGMFFIDCLSIMLRLSKSVAQVLRHSFRDNGDNKFSKIINVTAVLTFLIISIAAILLGIIFQVYHIKSIISKSTPFNQIDSNLVSFPFINWELMLKLDWSSLGEATGIISALFAGLAVVLVYATLREQKKELQETRNVMQYQQIENSLFQMFNALDGIVSAISMEVGSFHVKMNSLKKSGSIVVNGRSSFKEVSEIFAIRYSFFQQINSRKLKSLTDEEIKKEKYITSDRKFDHERIIGDMYSSMWKELRAGYSHYFRYLYRILKVIEESNLNNVQKIKLSRVVRAQLSDYELLIIFYNCNSIYGKNLLHYVKKYQILDNLTKNILIPNTNHYAILKSFNENVNN